MKTVAFNKEMLYALNSPILELFLNLDSYIFILELRTKLLSHSFSFILELSFSFILILNQFLTSSIAIERKVHWHLVVTASKL